MQGSFMFCLFATLTQRLHSRRFTGRSPQARGGGAAWCRGIRARSGGAGLRHGRRGLLILRQESKVILITKGLNTSLNMGTSLQKVLELNDTRSHFQI